MPRAILLLAALLLPSAASAALEPATLEELIGASDLILVGRVSRFEIDAQAAGSAVIEPIQVLKGQALATPPLLRWSADPDEQRLAGMDQEYVLFLARTQSGAWRPARQGVSYWPLRRTAGKARPAVAYEFPLTLLTIPEGALLKRAAFFTPSGEREELEAVYLDDLVALIAAPARAAPGP